jgi:hypothetical protein
MKRCLFAITTLIILLGIPAAIFAQIDSGNAESEIRDALEKSLRARQAIFSFESLSPMGFRVNVSLTDRR